MFVRQIKFRTNLFSALIILSILLILLSCLNPAIEPQTIKIGVIAPTTGNIPIVGDATVKAAELAVAEVNQSGGLTVGGQKLMVELVIIDSQDQAEVAVQAMRRLINQENVVAVIGPQASRNAIPAATVAEQAHVPMISPWSTNPQTTEGKSYIFRIAYIDSFQGRVMARFTQEELGLTKAAVLYDEASAYNRDLAEIYRQAFEELGGEIVAFEAYVTGQTDYTAQLEAIKQAQAEILFLPNYYNEVGEQARQAKTSGLNMPLLGSDTWSSLQPEDLPALNGAFFSTHYDPDIDSEVAQQFIQTYKALHNETPDDVAALTYDAFKLLFQVITTQGQVDTEAIRKGLANTEQYVGVTGLMEYQGSGDPIKSAVILQVNNGQTNFYKLANP